ncbi:DUF3199 family protein [Sporosarcina sp. Marseille-Q4943]|uniref:protein YqbG n=1 Tax=Sporosarcina sp. Marseille-Q4943 TaxID=2942204 RepID=UPI00208DA4E1|nr:DUF3199 family protein [Sporosarcina sp. Marseille-Q4943]
MSITPTELQAYTDFEAVKERAAEKLELDILEAETYIEKEIGKSLSEFTSLPRKLRLALLKVAQFFALVNGDESLMKGYKSEKIGDYSYTLGDGSKMTMPDVLDLLDEYMEKESSTGGFFMRMRPL